MDLEPALAARNRFALPAPAPPIGPGPQRVPSGKIGAPGPHAPATRARTEPDFACGAVHVNCRARDEVPPQRARVSLCV